MPNKVRTKVHRFVRRKQAATKDSFWLAATKSQFSDFNILFEITYSKHLHQGKKHISDSHRPHTTSLRENWWSRYFEWLQQAVQLTMLRVLTVSISFMSCVSHFSSSLWLVFICRCSVAFCCCSSRNCNTHAANTLSLLKIHTLLKIHS